MQQCRPLVSGSHVSHGKEWRFKRLSLKLHSTPRPYAELATCDRHEHCGLVLMVDVRVSSLPGTADSCCLYCDNVN